MLCHVTYTYIKSAVFSSLCYFCQISYGRLNKVSVLFIGIHNFKLQWKCAGSFKRNHFKMLTNRYILQQNIVVMHRDMCFVRMKRLFLY